MMPPSSGWGLICSLNYARQMSCRSIWLLKPDCAGRMAGSSGDKRRRDRRCRVLGRKIEYRAISYFKTIHPPPGAGHLCSRPPLAVERVLRPRRPLSSRRPQRRRRPLRPLNRCLQRLSPCGEQHGIPGSSHRYPSPLGPTDPGPGGLTHPSASFSAGSSRLYLGAGGERTGRPHRVCQRRGRLRAPVYPGTGRADTRCSGRPAAA